MLSQPPRRSCHPGSDGASSLPHRRCQELSLSADSGQQSLGSPQCCPPSLLLQPALAELPTQSSTDKSGKIRAEMFVQLEFIFKWSKRYNGSKYLNHNQHCGINPRGQFLFIFRVLTTNNNIELSKIQYNFNFIMLTNLDNNLEWTN